MNLAVIKKWINLYKRSKEFDKHESLWLTFLVEPIVLILPHVF